MKIYLGIYQIKHAQYAPQFMFSVRRLISRRTSVPFNNYNWMLDSGAFSEINLNGKYTFTPEEYLHYVELHQPTLFFNMDYICEPFVLQKTGMTVKQHQSKTLDNQIRIMDLLDNYDIKSNFAGCIQGWQISDYLNCIDMLKEHGLITSIMGVGSICRRNSEYQIIKILEAIKQELPNTKLHGFGIKTDILKIPIVYKYLNSCDSMAWSFAGRKSKKLCMNCKYPNVKNCANCHYYMLNWYNKLVTIQNKTCIQQTF